MAFEITAAEEIKAPAKWPQGFKIFVAGTIDQGQSEDWQSQVAQELADYDVILLNPRREDWDENASEELIRDQIAWEQDGLDEADFRIFVFLKDSKSPVTFMELGEHLEDPGAVMCPEGFWRKQNIDETCARKDMPVFESLDELIRFVKVILDEMGLGQKGKTAATQPVPGPDSGFKPWYGDGRPQRTKLGPEWQPEPREQVTDTPEFRKWFGESKVVDARGNPLMVYHGSKSATKEFSGRGRSALAQLGHWFDADPGTAHGYTGGGSSADRPNMIPAYLSIQNPKVFVNVDAVKDAAEGKWGPTPVARARKLRVDLKKAGYDGILVQNSTNGSGNPDWWVAFDQKQVKNAIGNSGDFNPVNPSIMASVKGTCTCGCPWEDHYHVSDFGCKNEPGCGCKGWQDRPGVKTSSIDGWLDRQTPGSYKGEFEGKQVEIYRAVYRGMRGGNPYRWTLKVDGQPVRDDLPTIRSAVDTLKEKFAPNPATSEVTIEDESTGTPVKAKLLTVLAYDYMAMFQPLLKLAPDTKPEIDHEIAWAKRALQKQNRIVWWLRWFRVGLADKVSQLVNDPNNYSAKDVPAETKQALRTLKQQYGNEATAKSGEQAFGGLDHVLNPRRWETRKEELEHLYSLQDPAVQEFDPGWKPIHTVIDMLKGLENEFKERAKSALRPKSEDTVFLDCGGGWAWWLLPRAACDDESRAMGHCGNGPERGRKDLSILSLRQKKALSKNDVRWEPHLTFILHRLGDAPDVGTLGEMKGKGNDKPAPRYHPQIIKLLEDPRIRGIDGGGYLPEHNFSPKDLTEEQRQQIEEANPGALMSLKQYYRTYGMDETCAARVATRLGIPNVENSVGDFILGSWTMKEFIEQRSDTEVQDLAAYLNDGKMAVFSKYLLRQAIAEDDPILVDIAFFIKEEFPDFHYDPENVEATTKAVDNWLENAVITDEGSYLREKLEAALIVGIQAEGSQEDWEGNLWHLIDNAIGRSADNSDAIIELEGDRIEQVLEEDRAIELALKGRKEYFSPPQAELDLDVDEDAVMEVLHEYLDPQQLRQKLLENHGQHRLFKRPETDEEARRDGVTVAKLLRRQAAATATEENVITVAPGTKLYRGVGEEVIKPPAASFDGCLWTTESHTMARSYIPASPSRIITSLDSLCQPQGRDQTMASIQKQLGFEFRNVQLDDRHDVRSFLFPTVYEHLAAQVPLPNKEDYSDTDAYYRDLFAARDKRKSLFQGWVAERLRELGYEPSNPRGRYDLRMGKGDTLLPNKNMEGTLLVFEPTQPLRIYDMTAGGKRDGDLMDPDYHKADDFRRLADEGYDGVKINDFAQVHGEGNVGHTAIGIFPKAVSKLKEVGRETTTHPEDWRAEVDKNGSAKTAFVSPTEAELTVTISTSARPLVTVELDFGLPNFTRFALSVPVAGLDNAAIDSYVRQAFETLLTQITAFLTAMKYDEEKIAGIVADASTAFLDLDAEDATDAGMSDQDPNVRMYEVRFPLPDGFADETRRRVVTAGVVRRTPDVQEMILTPVPGTNPDDQAEGIIQFYRDQATKSTPRPFRVNVRDVAEAKRDAGPKPRQWEDRMLVEVG